VFNGSTIGAVVVCALTFNMKRAAAPGNVLLKKGEENLKKASVANITQLVTVDKADLVERIGTLSPPRVREIVDGIRLLIEPRDLPRQQRGCRTYSTGQKLNLTGSSCPRVT